MPKDFKISPNLVTLNSHHIDWDIFIKLSTYLVKLNSQNIDWTIFIKLSTYLVTLNSQNIDWAIFIKLSTCLVSLNSQNIDWAIFIKLSTRMMTRYLLQPWPLAPKFPLSCWDHPDIQQAARSLIRLAWFRHYLKEWVNLNPFGKLGFHFVGGRPIGYLMLISEMGYTEY